MLDDRPRGDRRPAGEDAASTGGASIEAMETITALLGRPRPPRVRLRPSPGDYGWVVRPKDCVRRGVRWDATYEALVAAFVRTTSRAATRSGRTPGSRGGGEPSAASSASQRHTPPGCGCCWSTGGARAGRRRRVVDECLRFARRPATGDGALDQRVLARARRIYQRRVRAGVAGSHHSYGHDWSGRPGGSALTASDRPLKPLDGTERPRRGLTPPRPVPASAPAHDSGSDAALHVS